jgi:hypothetical protein
MKRAASQRFSAVIFGTVAFLVLSTNQSLAAQLFTTINSSCSGYGMVSNLTWASQVNIPSAATITSVEYKFSGSESRSNVVIKFVSDSSGAPSTNVLGTFAFDTSTSTTGIYKGNVSLPASGRYWLTIGSSTLVYPCYTTNAVTTGSLSGWTSGTSYESNNSGTTFPNSYANYNFDFVLYGSGGGATPLTSSIALSSSSTAIYRQTMAITASLGVAGTDGKVTFYANGKKIAGCISKPTSSLTASCSWKPTQRGSVNLTAKLVPTDVGYLLSTSPVKSVTVSNRLTRR